MFDEHIKLAYAQNILIMLLCVLGVILNMAMLVIFCAKKQVRGSVYTTYMIQIAFTDLIICAIWFTMAALFLDDVTNVEERLSGEMSTIELLTELSGSSRSDFYRFAYGLYYLHYYFNIFLLATMSVERCAAVWKSMRCQKHDIAHKFIVIVSVVMGLIALACALPAFVDPTLITDNENSARSTTNSNATAQFPSERRSSKYIRCYTLLRHAVDTNLSYVMDFDGTNVTECVDMMDYDMIRLLHHMNESKSDQDLFAELADLETESDLDLFGDLYDYNITFTDDDPYEIPPLPEDITGHPMLHNIEWPTGSGSHITVADKILYEHTLRFAWNLAPADLDWNNMCDPFTSHEAQIYLIVVNLVIGFAIPFAAIVVSYVYIAYMIGKRARQRMEESETPVDQSCWQRLSDFLKQFVSGGQVYQTDGDRTPPYHFGASPLLRRNIRHRLLINDKADSGVERSRPTTACTTLTPQSPESPSSQVTFEASTPFVNGETETPGRPRLPQLSSPVELRRTSGGSASSTESFQTSQTSIHTSSSPGVKMSAPTFINHDRALVQRACSAESGTSGPSRSSQHSRWSGDVFRSQSLEEDQRKRSSNQPEEFDSLCDTLEHDSIQSKRTSGLPSRGVLPDYDSTQEGGGLRLYSQRSDAGKRQYNRQFSSMSNYRGRAYSGASRVSTGNGGTLRKSVSQSHAERHMRVSRTVLLYVVVFALCWLPQRIVFTLFVTNGLIENKEYTCHALFSITRIISFISVLLNPIVYAMTQRELQLYLRKFSRVVFRCGARNERRKSTGRATAKGGHQQNRGLVENENRDFSMVAEHNVTSEDVSKRERHLHNKELWSRMFQRLGRKSIRTSLSGSGLTVQGDKPSDGTIDEERDDEVKGPNSKAESSSSSIKLISNWDDIEQLFDAAKNEGKLEMKETIF